MQRIDVLVTYDMDTTTKAGRSRLRKVAQVCKNFGQRVQFSVFELSVSLAQLESFEAKLLEIINPNNLVLYLRFVLTFMRITFISSLFTCIDSGWCGVP